MFFTLAISESGVIARLEMLCTRLDRIEREMREAAEEFDADDARLALSKAADDLRELIGEE